MPTAHQEQEHQMKKIYNDILLSRFCHQEKNGQGIAGYGKKAIPLIQELRNVETNEEVKNYMFDTITQIEKVDVPKEHLK
jgi:hypothetical protein